jgi:hypothetical protein
MSQNMTVIWRRSPDDTARGAVDGSGDDAEAGTGASLSLPPHCAQKREPAALTWPQPAQARLCGAPHCGQKRLPSEIAV